MTHHEIQYWQQRTIRDYFYMQSRHIELWEFVYNFILDNEIQTALEVGCGLVSPVRNWVPKYQAVDRNEATRATHCDFMDIDPNDMRDLDLLLACGVIEHIEHGYEALITHVLKIAPRYALLSFFNGLDRPENVFMQNDNGFWKNRYSETRITDYLLDTAVKFRTFTVTSKDTILVLYGERQ